ncbi:MAG: Fic family protein [Candidatus Limnocylindrales bacterium]
MRLPATAPTLEQLFERIDLNERLPRIFEAVASPTVDGEYPHWDDLRRRRPPEGLTLEEWWLGIKYARVNLARAFPLQDPAGKPFDYCLTDEALSILHWIDQHGAGEILVSEEVPEPADRSRYLVSSLIEEAITSSQLEGATSSRRVAKEMLRSGRAPRDRSERMILNNYRAMTRIAGFASQPLTPELVYELHRILTEHTLDDRASAGRPQQPGEVRVGVFDPEGLRVHTPPPAEQLPARMDAMCRFANGQADKGFVHPVVRAILLHLWLAYDHPFEDGNGRTARAIFYWSMLHSGYWMFEYVSISRILHGAPARYARSFLYTETDERDATYFLIHGLSVMRRAIDELLEYLRRKMREVHQTVGLLRQSTLNHRQVALLTHALRHSDAEYTVRSHSTSHRVTPQSARTDLLDLERRGMLARRQVGKRFVFSPVADLAARVANS